MDLDINEMVEQVHENAKEKGWWDQERTPLEIHMLIVSEIAEATEEVRSGNKPLYFEQINDIEKSDKPEGEAIELADAVIRIMDYFGKKNWDLRAMLILKHEYNKTRPYRHGGKKA